jgi:hypothetical protein
MGAMSLPSPTAYDLGAEATIVVPVSAEGLIVHRLLEHETPHERDFESRLSRTQARLQRLPELFRASISHWLEHSQAVRASERRTASLRVSSYRTSA